MTEATDARGPDFFCSTQSRESGEHTLGTAPRADVWFMLEYAGRWGSKAFDESSLSEDVKAGVNAQLAEIPNSRLLLIKRESQAEGEIHFFAAAASAVPPQLYRFILEDYEELLDIDWAALARGHAQFDAARVDYPIFLVCTNGLRDKCCARNGVVAYGQLQEEFGDMIWQSTHHGGHRFGANLLCMPYGLSYGRMDLGGAVDTVRALLEDRVPLENLRGRSIYANVEQAAEGLLRAEGAVNGLAPPTLRESREGPDGEWEVHFELNGQAHRVKVRRQASDTLIYAACVGDKLAPLVEYSLLGHAAV